MAHSSCRPCPLSRSPLRFASSPITPSFEAWPSDAHRYIMSSPTRSPPQKPNEVSHYGLRSAGINSSPPAGRSADFGLTTNRHNVSKLKFSSRMIKPNPLILHQGAISGNEKRETRRKLFLRKVKEASEQKRWRERESRVGNPVKDDEILRALWIVDNRRWHEQREKEALGLDSPGVLENIPEEINESERDFAELEDFLLAERSNSYDGHIVENLTDSHREILSADATYDNEDDEYDSIFLQFIENEDVAVDRTRNQFGDDEDQDVMDTS